MTAHQRRIRRHGFQGTVLDVMDTAGLTGVSWLPWRAVLSAAFGLHLGAEVRAFLSKHTGREVLPPSRVSEAWCVAGRRGGKSRIAAVVAFYLAISFDPARLAPGELALVPIIAADRRQARVVFSYLRALTELPEFMRYVSRTLRESVELVTATNIEVLTASYRTVRGYTMPGAVLDEVAFWKDEATSSNPDSEILDALRPSMATIDGALLWAISSPYGRRGELWNVYDRYFGQPDAQVLIVNSDTRSLNPLVPERVIDRAFEEDSLAAASEYGHDGSVVFRADVETFLAPEAVRAVTVQDRRELPPRDGVTYVGFVDPSGGSADSFTLAVAHCEDDSAILDAVRETRPPFSPDAVVADYAALLRSYRCTKVVGDRYGGSWPRERFAAYGIRYTPSERVKSDLYRELIAPVNGARVQLLDLPILRTQLLGLERRVARSGRDSIDHAVGARDDVSNAVAGALLLALPAGRSRRCVVIRMSGMNMGSYQFESRRQPPVEPRRRVLYRVPRFR